MPIFKLRRHRNANNEQAIADYAAGIRLLVSECSRFNIDLKGMFDIEDDRYLADYNLAWDIQNYPHLWQKNRIGASKLESDKNSLLSFEPVYERLHKLLMAELKKLSYFKVGDREKIKFIDELLHRLEGFQQEAVRAFMARLRYETANDLQQKLTKLSEHCRILQDFECFTQIMPDLKPLTGLDVDQIFTTEDALHPTRRANKCRNNLLKAIKKLKSYVDAPQHYEKLKFDSDDLCYIAQQVSIVTKLEMDYYYENPRKLSTFDKVRKGITTAAMVIGGVTGFASFVLFFIPGMQLFALILGLISIVGMLPLMDSLFEVCRNLWYGRTPTKAQVIELGVAIPLIATLMVGAHALPLIGGLIVSKASAIVKKLTTISVFIATKFLSLFGGSLNMLSSIFNYQNLRKAYVVKTEEAATNRSTLSLYEGLGLMRANEKNLKGVACTLLTEAVFAKTLTENSGQGMGFLCKGRNPNPEKAELVLSQTENIRNWGAGFFVDRHLGVIDRFVKSYNSLPADCSVSMRLSAIKSIESAIQEFQTAWDKKQKPNVNVPLPTRIQELKTWVEQERTALTPIQDSKPYLVYAPIKCISV